jgi:S1-C subfamily serine protease
MLADNFKELRRSIVAFASLAVRTKRSRKPVFPELIGTGFVIDSRGIVATNRHVVRALEKLPNNPKTGVSSAIALTFSDVSDDGSGSHSLKVVPVSIRRWDKLTTFTSSEHFFGEQKPDLAFAQLNVDGLPAVSVVRDKGSWEVGTAIATAGFPLGTRALAIYGKINQVAPILRSGIIASVYPFPCPRPHGFTIDIMTLGGESGSPIFLRDSPKVVGLLHAGFNGTNITLAVPSWLVAQACDHYMKTVPLNFTGVPRFDEVVAASK